VSKTQFGGPLGRAPSLGAPKDVLSMALAWASVPIGALLLGNMEGRCFHRAFEIKRYEKIPYKLVSLSTGATWGEPGGSNKCGGYTL
jgi:hypothetical protein